MARIRLHFRGTVDGYMEFDSDSPADDIEEYIRAWIENDLDPSDFTSIDNSSIEPYAAEVNREFIAKRVFDAIFARAEMDDEVRAEVEDELPIPVHPNQSTIFDFVAIPK